MHFNTKPRIACYLSSDKHYIFALGNTILQLKQHDYIDTILLYIDCDDKILHDSIIKLDNRIKFVDFSCNEILSKLHPDLINSSFFKTYGTSIFSRFLVTKYLDDYDSIVVLDCDLLIRDSFLDQIDLSYALIYHPSGKLKQHDSSCNSDKYQYPHGGFIVINKLLLNYNISTEYYFKLIMDNFNLPHIDELVFALLWKEFDFPVKLISDKYNCWPIKDYSQNAVIIHGLSLFKFWKNPISMYLFPSWISYNTLWNEFCDSNRITKYKYIIKTHYQFSNYKLFLLPHVFTIHTLLLNLHPNLRFYSSITDLVVNIYIKDLPKDFCFKIVGNPYNLIANLQLLDLNSTRCASSLNMVCFNNLKLKNSLSDFDFKIEHSFSASKQIHYSELCDRINEIYNDIHSEIISYICHV